MIALRACFVLVLLWSIVPAVVACGEPKVPPTAAPSSTNAKQAIVRLETTDDAHGVVAVRKDGTRTRVLSDHTRIMAILETSKDLKWATVEWSTEDEAMGSLGGSVGSHTNLLSVEHKRLLEPEDLGLPPGAAFDGFGERDGTAVLLVGIKREVRALELAKLGGMLTRPAGSR